LEALAMSAKLTRKALYDLVWSKPRTTLAKEMGVSDVWIGKQCRALNVPAPPPGYWASIAAGGKPKAKYPQPPLSYTVAERMQADHDPAAETLEGFDAEDLERPVPAAPAFDETIEQAVARYIGLARGRGRLRPSGHHPVVQRLLAEDDRRASQASPYSWEQPLYRDAQGQAVVQAIDKIAWHWTDCGLRVAASGRHNIELFVVGGSHSTRFEIRAAPTTERSGRRGRPPTRAALEFWLDPERDDRRRPGKPALSFKTLDNSTIHAVTVLLLSKWEHGFRQWLQWRHEHFVESRERAIRAVQEALRRERKTA
jgi:hypothetical protein